MNSEEAKVLMNALALESHRVHLTANALSALVSRATYPGDAKWQQAIAKNAVDLADATMRALGIDQS